MAYAFVVYTGDGSTTQFSIPFSYIRKEHVKVYVNYVDTAYTYVNDTTVSVSTAPGSGVRVEVRRVTPANTPLVDFANGAVLTAADLDTANLQQLYLQQELDDDLGKTVQVDDTTGLLTAGGQRITSVGTPSANSDATTKSYVDTEDATFIKRDGTRSLTGNLPAGSNKITGLATPTDSGDASTKGYVDGLITTNQGYVTAAANSAAAAATSETNAATSEANAATSEANAANSAVNAATAQTAAETARDQTLAAYDSFDDRYLGVKTSDPTLDNDGNALVAGALYFSSTLNEMRLYTGAVWVAAYVSGNAASVGFTATGTISATTVQGAIQELLDETSHKTAATGSLALPTGTTGQRDGSPSAGYLRFNTTDGKPEVYSGSAWGSVGGGATGGGSDTVFHVNGNTVNASYSIPSSSNAVSAGPITVASGAVVTIPSGSAWVIV